MFGITGKQSNVNRAACRKCGHVGHLTFQCRNFTQINPGREIVLDVSSTSSESEEDFISPLQKLSAVAEEKMKREAQNKTHRSRSPLNKHKKHKKHKRHRSTNDHESDSTSKRDSSSRRKKRKSKRHSSSSDSDSSDTSDSEGHSRHNHKKHTRHKHRKHSKNSKKHKRRHSDTD